MNKKNLLTIAATIGLSLSSFAAQASSAEVLEAKLVAENQAEVTLRSHYYCNDPIVTVEYLYSAKAVFGPHYYEIKVMPVNKMFCVQPREHKAVVTLPDQGPMAKFVIRGENDTAVQVEEQSKDESANAEQQ